MRKSDYSIRDREGQVSFYVLLWKRKGINIELFDNYWKDVHGPVCARLPGQYQYWQFHVAHNDGGIWPTQGDLVNASSEAEQFDGIAELTFKTEADRDIWFKAAAILMDDEHNIFSKAIGYTTSLGNSITYIDSIENGAPNGEVDVEKYHCPIRKADGVSVEAFRHHLKEKFVPVLADSDRVVKCRLHLFDEVDNSRPDAGGVSHYEPPEFQYQAALEIAFWSRLDMELLLASAEYQLAVRELPEYVKEIKPFPERSAYTFVYDGQMTLAGERSAKVAELIMKIGAENQLREEIKALILCGEAPSNGKVPDREGLGHLLQGVQHIGVTTDNMEKSLEFYTEVLGGKVVVGEDDLIGDGIQNTLLQKEELDAIARGVDLEALGVPNFRDAKEALDVKFISFGNTVVELLYIKDPATGKMSPDRGRNPSHIGNVNAMHLSFHVKEDMDLDAFANLLEEECHKRGMTNVLCNRTIRVRSEAERRAVALKYNSTKFWDDPELLARGEPAQEFGELEGWALFYCKGPSGEQLEFNQATLHVKTLFQKAAQEYNRTAGTSFVFSDAKIPGTIRSAASETIPRVQATASSPVNASLSTVWQVMQDKIYNPARYNSAASNSQILARYSDGAMRQMQALGMTLKERIAIDDRAKAISHTLVENPSFAGKAVNAIVLPNRAGEPLQITYSLDWEPLNEDAQTRSPEIQEQVQKAVRDAVANTKAAAERQEARTNSPTSVTAPTRKENSSMSEQFPGQNTDLVKRLFSRGEAFDAEGFITFFTDKPVYQFGNFDVCLDKDAIKKSADNFFSQINAVYHEIKMIWELGDVVFVEMDVTYWRKDNSVISLPCCDIFRVDGDKFSELRIFMDVNPVFNKSIPVPASASVLTASQGKKLIPPGTMKRHFAEHPEAQQRIADGYVPKWSIAGPNWPINPADEANGRSSEQFQAVGELAQGVVSQNWDKVKSYLTDDVFYKVGSGEPRYGRQEVVEFFADTFKTTAVFTGHKVRKVWQEPDVITIEMDAYYELVPSKKQVTIACCDIYRMRGNKVSEWRVYADMSPWNGSR